MKKTLILFILFIYHWGLSQNIITIKSENDNKPLANVSISCNGKLLGKTDASGVIKFKTKCTSVSITADGYYDEEVLVKNTMEVLLSKIEKGLQNIKTVILEDKSDPKAIAILKKVNENYKNNNPNSLDSYSYKLYEKISLDLDKDSLTAYSDYIDKHLDSLKNAPKTAKKKEPKKKLTTKEIEERKKDSLDEVRFLNILKESKPFLWERASEHLFSKKYGEKTNILDNKVSGLQQPFYEMMALRSNRNQIPRQLRLENRNLYRYFLTDSLEIEGRKTFVIKFREVEDQQAKRRRKFNGFIFVDAATYGLKKIESKSRKKNEGNIMSNWEYLFGKWFLQSEDIKFRIGQMRFNQPTETETKNADENTGETKDEKENPKRKYKKFGQYLSLKSNYFDVKSPIEVSSKDFTGYTLEVKNSDGKTLDKYRVDTLSEREKTTYVKIDSIGKKFKLDQKANLLKGILHGNIRIGMVDFGINQVFGYNKYEGVRLGLGAKLNENFNRYISPDAYFAYGFKDHAWKYGAGIDFKTTLSKSSFFRIEYFKDVQEAGRFNENLWNFTMLLMNSGVDLYNDKFYRYQGFKFSYENDLSNATTLRVSLKKSTEEAGFAYDFENLGSHFQNFSGILTLKYAPNSKNMMTPSGKFTYDSQLPELYLNYEQGLKALGGQLDYSRFDALFVHRFKTDLGLTGYRIYGGLVLGKTPIWNHFTMEGLSESDLKLNFNLTTYLGFATMEGGKYYNDKFIGTYLTHRIPWYFKTFGNNISSFDVVYKGIIGEMLHPEEHHFQFQKLNRLYNEVGFEWNNFLSTKFNLGFFYRVGYYNTPKFKDNFAIQLKLKILGF